MGLYFAIIFLRRFILLESGVYLKSGVILVFHFFYPKFAAKKSKICEKCSSLLLYERLRYIVAGWPTIFSNYF